MEVPEHLSYEAYRPMY